MTTAEEYLTQVSMDKPLHAVMEDFAEIRAIDLIKWYAGMSEERAKEEYDKYIRLAKQLTFKPLKSCPEENNSAPPRMRLTALRK